MENTFERPGQKKLLHERYKKTDLCIHCNQILASWEWKQECPARLAEVERSQAILEAASSEKEAK